MAASPISISNDRSLNIVRIGGLSIVFSYDATVAFTDDQGRSYVNPRYRSYSKTTSKHLNAAGYKDDPDAPSEAHFNAYLADALVRASQVARDELLQALP